MAVTTRANKVTDLALKQQYAKYMDLLNYGADWVKLIKVQGERYIGRQLLVPLRTTKIQPGLFVNESDPQPTPVDARSTSILFDVVIYIAKMATSWVAQEFDEGSVVKLSRDLEDWIKSNNENLEYAAIFGHKVRGVISERVGGDGAGGTDPAIVIDQAQNDNLGVGSFASLPQRLDYDGDYRCFRALGSSAILPNEESLLSYPTVLTNPTLATVATWVPINLRALDDYALLAAGHGITLNGAATAFQFYVVATDELAGTIDVVALVNAGNTSEWQMQVGIATNGYLFGVEMGETIVVGVAPAAVLAAGNITCWTNHISKEMLGVLSCLYAGAYGGIDRAAGTRALRSKAWSVSALFDGGRAPLTAGRIIALLDIVTGMAGQAPKQLFVNPLFHSIYIAGLGATINLNNEGGRYKFDGVPEVDKLAGYAMTKIRRLPRGLILFATPETFKIVTPQKGGGLGGVPMLRFRAKLKDRDSETHLNTTTTVWGVFQQVCFAPRENAILAGLNIVNELLD